MVFLLCTLDLAGYRWTIKELMTDTTEHFLTHSEKGVEISLTKGSPTPIGMPRMGTRMAPASFPQTPILNSETALPHCLWFQGSQREKQRGVWGSRPSPYRSQGKLLLNFDGEGWKLLRVNTPWITFKCGMDGADHTLRRWPSWVLQELSHLLAAWSGANLYLSGLYIFSGTALDQAWRQFWL